MILQFGELTYKSGAGNLMPTWLDRQEGANLNLTAKRDGMSVRRSLGYLYATLRPKT